MEFLPFYDASDLEFDWYFQQNYHNLPKHGDVFYDSIGEWGFYYGAWYVKRARNPIEFESTLDEDDDSDTEEDENNQEENPYLKYYNHNWSYDNGAWVLSNASDNNPLEYPNETDEDQAEDPLGYPPLEPYDYDDMNLL
jgi:hypothetical protein